MDSTAQIERLFAGVVPEIVREPMTVKAIAEMVADDFNIPVHEVMGDRRHKDTTIARHVAQWLCKKHASWSLAHTGRRFGRDHTSVMHGCERIDQMMAANVVFHTRVENLSNSVTERWPHG